MRLLFNSRNIYDIHTINNTISLRGYHSSDWLNHFPQSLNIRFGLEPKLVGL